MTTTGSRIVVRTVIVVAAAGMWFVPPPAGLSVAAWRLFALFAAAIASVVLNAFPILTASVLAVAAAVLTSLLPAEKAYSGFANGTILRARDGEPFRAVGARFVVQHLSR
jgi:DASS family divalent anion:Na+ symporter